MFVHHFTQSLVYRLKEATTVFFDSQRKKRRQILLCLLLWGLFSIMGYGYYRYCVNRYLDDQLAELKTNLQERFKRELSAVEKIATMIWQDPGLAAKVGDSWNPGVLREVMEKVKQAPPDLQPVIRSRTFIAIADDRNQIRLPRKPPPKVAGKRLLANLNDGSIYAYGLYDGERIQVLIIREIGGLGPQLCLGFPTDIPNLPERYKRNLYRGELLLFIALLLAQGGILFSFKKPRKKKNAPNVRQEQGKSSEDSPLYPVSPEIEEDHADDENTTLISPNLPGGTGTVSADIHKSHDFPTTIGAYELVAPIGEGAMACVFLAKKSQGSFSKRNYAVKISKPDLSPKKQEVLDQLFQREKEIAEITENENIIQVYDYEKEEPYQALVLEYVQGMNLAQIAWNIPLSVEQVTFIASEILQGLHYIHSEKQIIHRDLKPSNILISVNGGVKISDFGIAKNIVLSQYSDETIIGSPVKGTPHYMSPEQLSGKPIDFRSDLYAFGLILYELLSRLAIEEIDPIIRGEKSKNIADLRTVKPDIPPQLDAIVMRCIKKDPNQRYQRAQAVYQDLSDFKQRSQITYDKLALEGFMKTLFNPSNSHTDGDFQG